MKVPLQYEESIDIRHDVVRFLFPSLPVEIQAAPTDISDNGKEDFSRATASLHPAEMSIPLSFLIPSVSIH